jgi:hypothetical protein
LPGPVSRAASARASGLMLHETELVAWLIEQHLTMSIVAQSRDLSDIRTIEDFAAIVQDRERLKLLLILTCVDIDAVGPGTWNDWKASLLRTLYEETETILTGGHTRTARAQRVASSRQELRDALTDWSDERFERYAERHYPAYWIRTDLNRRSPMRTFSRCHPARRQEPSCALRTLIRKAGSPKSPCLCARSSAIAVHAGRGVHGRRGVILSMRRFSPPAMDRPLTSCVCLAIRTMKMNCAGPRRS